MTNPDPFWIDGASVWLQPWLKGPRGPATADRFENARVAFKGGFIFLKPERYGRVLVFPASTVKRVEISPGQLPGGLALPPAGTAPEAGA